VALESDNINDVFVFIHNQANMKGTFQGCTGEITRGITASDSQCDLSLEELSSAHIFCTVRA